MVSFPHCHSVGVPPNMQLISIMYFQVYMHGEIKYLKLPVNTGEKTKNAAGTSSESNKIKMKT